MSSDQKIPINHPAPAIPSTPESTAPPGLDAIVQRLRAAGCVFAEDEARLLHECAPTQADLLAMVRRRVAGQPLEHIIGWVDFCGLRIAIDPGVFVPRRRTELMVRYATRLARAAVPARPTTLAEVGRPTGTGQAGTDQAGTGQAGTKQPDQRVPVVVDLACGCGAIGLTVAAHLAAPTMAALRTVATPTSRMALYAVDIDPAAVACARRNLASVGGQVWMGDLYTPLPAKLRGRVDVLTANVPYVPSAAIDLLPREAREHEPLVALDGGADGLDLLRRVASGARDWLALGGHVLMEIAEDQEGTASRALIEAGLEPRVARDEELGATLIIGRRSA